VADIISTQGELTALFRRQFELCKVRAGEQIAIMHDAGTREDYVQASIGSLASLGATPVPVRIPGIGQISMPGSLRSMGIEPESLAPTASESPNMFSANSPTVGPLAAIIPAVDMVVDLARLQHAPGRGEALAAGKRMLTIVEPPDCLQRLFPTHELKAQSQVAASLIQHAATMHVTSDAGTDLVAAVDPDYVTCLYGFVDEPGRWDNWPAGFAAMFSKRGSAKGQIVLDVGATVFEFFRYVESPVTCKIEDGYITDVSGSGVDAMLLRDYLEGWNDPECYALSHLGWGMNPFARWEALQLYSHGQSNGQDARAFRGSFMWSTGPTPQLGRFVPGHLDLCMRDCSISLDDEPVVKSGQLVHPALAALAPIA
jgi:2,5-dihydroxypyridine 5,6-dioxygenase